MGAIGDGLRHLRKKKGETTINDPQSHRHFVLTEDGSGAPRTPQLYPYVLPESMCGTTM
jgi:hypothetical protein